VICSCCGGVILRAEDNVAVPGEHDIGYGMCRSCGGDPDAPDPEPGDSAAVEEKKSRAQMGAGLCMFIDARIPIIEPKLSDKNRAHFATLPYWKKAVFVMKLVEDGDLT
jgi:hypothetical protein